MIDLHYLRCTQENKINSHNREIKINDGYKKSSTLKENLIDFIGAILIFTPILILFCV